MERDSGYATKGKGKQLAAGETSSAGWEWVVAVNGTRKQLRGPIDDAWSHGEKWKSQGWKCGYCPAARDSGGKTRLRLHLAGLRGDGEPCLNVPHRVREIMLGDHAKGTKKRADAKERRLFVEKAIIEETYRDVRRANIPRDEAGQVEWALRESLRDQNAQYSSPPFGSSPPLDKSSSRSSNHTPPLDRARCSRRQSTMDRYYRSPSVSQTPFDIDLERSKMSSQPRVDIMLQGGAKERLGRALAKWFHANDIPRRKADCPYFVAAIKIAQQLGEGVAIPRGRDIDGPLLDINYDDLRARMDDHKEDWRRFGVTIMCDSWTGPTMMCIINFMVFCNGLMFFHKTVDATGHKQNAEFIFDCIEEVIVKDLAHTINLMLKDIACFDEVGELLYSAKRMCRFLYKHNRLHAMMKDKIGGELIRWNATRFGTLFLFLQSFLDRQEKFQSWMVSSDWKNNDRRDEDDHKFTYDCLTDRIWWNKVELVLKAVTPLYSVLRFVDQDKNGTISGFVPRMLHAQAEIFAKLKHDKNASRDIINRLNEVINRRTRYLVNGTLMSTAAGLDPYALYTSKLVKNPSVVFAVTMAIKKLASSPSEASMAIDQFTKTFSKQAKLFASLEARSSALRRETSPAEWWNSYGGQCKELQKIAIRIVSQCSSSSGCEQNWSTFALVHTKLRARLGYEKLEKLVYVHYNLKLCIKQFEGESDKKEIDLCSMMMDLALFDENNPIMDWFSNSRAESTPILDEYDDDDDDWTAPGGFLISELGMNDSEMSAFKRDLQFGKNKKRKLL
ncbi:hypothetical protein U9M48_004548 [Paspalum notatum var. saurae]|uniref:HAT C-terminal dimerisation domain-containing protein n=1 Tax=Paspalum notatum var. saurae TaxID=547442 RepID=A0AAQ3PMW6_PASNO